MHLHRVGQHGGQQRRLRGSQRTGVLVPEALRGGLYPVDAVAELRDIQVHLENALLGPAGLDKHREVRLQTLAHEGVAGPQEQILGHLLRDRARAAQVLALLAGAHCRADGVQVEAGVEGEQLVFGGHYGDGGVRGYLLQVHPPVVGAVVVALRRPRLHRGLHHHGAGQRVEPAQQQHRDHAQGEPAEQ